MMISEKEFQKLIEKLLSDDINQVELKQLEDYAAKYPEYKYLLDLHQDLGNVDFPVKVPTAEKFSQMRADVMREIRLKGQKSPGFFEETINKIRDFAFRPEMAVAALTLILGFFLGRALPPDEENLASNLIKQISLLATESTKMEDVQKSPVVYSNVRYQDLEDNMVAMKLDATTHLDFVRKKDDPLVLEVMAQTLLSASNVGSELQAISYSEGIVDPKFKETLIYTLHNKPQLATRLKAMSRLSDYKNDMEIKQAFLKVLRDEESVKMRLLAIEYLTNERVSPDTLRHTLEESEVTQSPAVLIKMRNYKERNDSKNSQIKE